MLASRGPPGEAPLWPLVAVLGRSWGLRGRGKPFPEGQEGDCKRKLSKPSPPKGLVGLVTAAVKPVAESSPVDPRPFRTRALLRGPRAGLAPRNEFGGPKSQPAAHSRARHPSGRARDARRRHRQRPTMDPAQRAPFPRAARNASAGPPPREPTPAVDHSDRAGRARDRARATRPAGPPAPALQRQRPGVSAPAPAFRRPVASAPTPVPRGAGTSPRGGAEKGWRPSAPEPGLQRRRPSFQRQRSAPRPGASGPSAGAPAF